MKADIEGLPSGFYFDVHGHPAGTLPASWRLQPGNTIPPDVHLGELPAAGVTGYLICALGDPNSFAQDKVDPFGFVRQSIGALVQSVADAKGTVAHDPASLQAAAVGGGPAMLLGIEGADFLAEDPERLPAVFDLGVRHLGLVHYARNVVGSISFGWGGKIVPPAERTGLSDFGRRIIRDANRLGMIIDLAHADDETIRGALDCSASPLLCSYTGPRALQDFPRYIGDDLMRGIARGGGLVGLWPFYSNGVGIPDLGTFGAYAAHCAELVGPEHIALGSDVNGVPGNMAGYRHILDAAKLVRALADRGFSRAEIAGIAGGNFLRFFKSLSR